MSREFRTDYFGHDRGYKKRQATMCGDTQREDMAAMFDAESRNVVSGDLATRYLGYPDDIIAEVCDAGFQVIEYCVIEDTVNPDLLLLDCQKPRSD